MFKKIISYFTKKRNHQKRTAKFTELINILKGTDPEKDNLKEFYKTSILQKNKENIPKFSAIPFSERIILLPQCLRNIDQCKAKEIGILYECQHCGACKIDWIIQKAKNLGYKGIYLLKGGSVISKIIEEVHPKALIGVACFYEGLIGITECEKHGIIVQFVPLTKDGCVNTDLNLDVLKNSMNLIK